MNGNSRHKDVPAATGGVRRARVTPLITSATTKRSESVPAAPSLVPVPSQYIRVLAFVRFKCTLSAFEDASALTLSSDDRGERGCLVEDTKRVFEPRERPHMDVRAGDGDRDVLRLRESESSLLTAAVHKQPSR
jgi:hypothetical protein